MDISSYILQKNVHRSRRMTVAYDSVIKYLVRRSMHIHTCWPTYSPYLGAPHIAVAHTGKFQYLAQMRL